LTKVEKSIEIHAPPTRVWEAIQPENMPQWYEEFKTVKWTSNEPHKKGATFQVDSVIADMKNDFDAEMVQVKDGEYGVWRTTSGNMKGLAIAMLTPSDKGTRLSMSMDYQLPYSVIGKMMDSVKVHKAVDRSFEVGLANLKYLLEN
jgi:uncharacterized membrane protein